MKVYIAAPWTQRLAAKNAAVKFLGAGHIITHRWWNFEAGDEDHARLRDLALMDLEGVQKADCLVVLNLEKSEGKAVEQGVALERGIPICLVGSRTNIFHHLDTDYAMFDTVEEVIDYLEQER